LEKCLNTVVEVFGTTLSVEVCASWPSVGEVEKIGYHSATSECLYIVYKITGSATVAGFNAKQWKTIATIWYLYSEPIARRTTGRYQNCTLFRD